MMGTSQDGDQDLYVTATGTACNRRRPGPDAQGDGRCWIGCDVGYNGFGLWKPAGQLHHGWLGFTNLIAIDSDPCVHCASWDAGFPAILIATFAARPKMPQLFKLMLFCVDAHRWNLLM